MNEWIFAAAAAAIGSYLVAGALIVGLVNGFKAVFPIPAWGAKAAAGALSALFVYAYDLNALAEVGLQSKYALFDNMGSIIVLALLTMAEYDVLKAFRK